MALMPGAFPWDHPRFLANRVLPALVLGLVVAAMGAARFRNWSRLRAIVLSLALLWLAAGAAAMICFPQSGGLIGGVGCVGSAMLIASAFQAEMRLAPLRRTAVAFALLGIAIGFSFPFTQIAPPADTHPANVDIPALAKPSQASAARAPATLRISELATVTPADGVVSMQNGRLFLSIQPLLTFASRSPDGCWVNLAPRSFRRSAKIRRLIAWQEEPAGFLYADDDESLLSVTGGDAEVTIEALSHLPAPVHSHLNSFCQITIAGHHRLSISFSPCADKKIEVLPRDYPVGRPARCAYLDAGGMFHVVQASSGEKGPFRKLAGGRMGRGEALTITLFDGATPIGRITLDDWSAQLSTQLSPTAGYGLPVNAIEFSLEGDRADAPAALWITLAGTSVGRGWDSVTHRAGTYRNRMHVELIQAGK